MPTEQAFWRLFADYERLTQNETAALRAEDWSGVAAVQARKTVLFSAMREAGESLGIDRSDVRLRSRLELLTRAEQANADWLAEQLSRVAQEQRELSASQQRARGFGQTYARTAMKGEDAWLAHG